MKKVGGLGSALSGLSGLSGIAGSIVVWTPASATTDGGVLPHTWQVPAIQNYQDAAKTTPATADSDPVRVSTNQGSDTYDVVAPADINRVTLRTGANGKNGQPIWSFGGSHRMVGAFSGGNLSKPYYVFSVAQLDASVVNNNNFYWAISDNDSASGILYQRGSAVPDKFSINSGAALDGPNTNANWHIFIAKFNNATSGLRTDGGAEVAGDAGSNAQNGFAIGGQNNFWVGNEGEQLIYQAALSLADINQILSYLGTKYDITISPAI